MFFINRIYCLEGTVPVCINVKDQSGKPTGVFKGLKVEVIRTVGEKIGFQTAFFEGGSSRYNKKTQEWTNGTIKQVSKVLSFFMHKSHIF